MKHQRARILCAALICGSSLLVAGGITSAASAQPQSVAKCDCYTSDDKNGVQVILPSGEYGGCSPTRCWVPI